MDFKYPENIKFKIVNINGVSSNWKFPKAGSCLEDCEKQGEFEPGEEVILKHKKNPEEKFQYYLVFDSGLESDNFSEKEIEILMGKEFINTYVKPPLGVTPKQIYELQRIQDLCRALHEYSEYIIKEHINDKYKIMLEWSEELTERLKVLSN